MCRTSTFFRRNCRVKSETKTPVSTPSKIFVCEFESFMREQDKILSIRVSALPKSFPLENQFGTCDVAQFILWKFLLCNRLRSYTLVINRSWNNVVGRFGFMRPFSYQQYPKFVSHIVTKNMTQVGATESNNRAIVWKQNYNFLRSVRTLDCYASFVVVVSLLNERIQGFYNIWDGSVLNSS